jgi:hypothetical protein
MPQTYQSPLTPLAFVAYIKMQQDQFRPPPYDWQTPDSDWLFNGQMLLVGAHNWYARRTIMVPHVVLSWPGQTFELRAHVVNLRVDVDWQANTTTLSIGTENYADWYYYAKLWTKVLPNAEQGRPWDTGKIYLTDRVGQAPAWFRAYRPVQPDAAALQMWKGGALPKGPLGPTIVENHAAASEYGIPGQTPPAVHVLQQRAKATERVHTDYGHVTRNAAFASAAQQWENLSQPDRNAWNAAGKALRPKIPGYALWTRIITAKRLDQIPALAARAGVTLVPPTLET